MKYNIFSGSERGPELYGTEPWFFYLLNLLLNFNILVPLALLSLPFLLITYFVDRKRVGLPTGVAPASGVQSPDQSSPFRLIAFRLAPLYLWLGVLSAQPHKEERFMFPVYQLICANAAVALYLVRGWAERIFIEITKSPYRVHFFSGVNISHINPILFFQASRTSLFQTLTRSIMATFIFISVTRIMALNHYYHAPLDVVFNFETKELPRLLNVTGLLPAEPALKPTSYSDDEKTHIDLTPIKQFDLRLCLGKEWYRFPSHYLIPDGINVQFVKSEFGGLLPRHFEQSKGHPKGIWKRDATRIAASGVNDLNKEEPGQYVSTLLSPAFLAETLFCYVGGYFYMRLSHRP